MYPGPSVPVNRPISTVMPWSSSLGVGVPGAGGGGRKVSGSFSSAVPSIEGMVCWRGRSWDGGGGGSGERDVSSLAAGAASGGS